MKIASTVLLVFLGGLGLVLGSFWLTGFPFPSEPISQLVWVELVFFLVLLGIPLLR